MLRRPLLSLLCLWLLAVGISACAGAGIPAPTENPLLQTRVALYASATTTPTRTQTPGGTQLPAYGPVIGPTLPGGQITLLPPTATVIFVATQAGATATFGPLFGATLTPPPTATPPPPTVLSFATSAGPTPTFGALVDPNHTPPPSFTPRPPEPTPTVSQLLPPLATAGASATPSQLLRADMMGVQIHANLSDFDWARALEYAKGLGVKWIKVQIEWREYEPQRGVYSEMLRARALQIQRARLQGFRTLVTVVKAPSWARPRGDTSVDDGPPTDPADYARFVGHVVAEIKPEFLDAIELWNEPNLAREWRDASLTGAAYMSLFRPAYLAVVEAQRQQPATHRIMVITAGPAPTFTNPDGSSVDDRTWLAQLYAAGLASLGEDIAVGVHPYGWANPPEATCCTAQPGVTGWYEYPGFYFRNTLEDYRAIMLQHDHARAKLWITEFGWATFDGLRRSDGSAGQPGGNAAWQALINQQQQADYVLRAFALAQQPPYYDYVGPMMLWNLNFATLFGFVDSSREEAGFSLLDQGWGPRPVYEAIQNAPKQ
jgi:hypothetical protein